MVMQVANYSGWTPRSYRNAKASSETGPQRQAKRSRMGTAADRALYKHAKAPKVNPARYSQLCRIADGLNGNR